MQRAEKFGQISEQVAVNILRKYIFLKFPELPEIAVADHSENNLVVVVVKFLGSDELGEALSPALFKIVLFGFDNGKQRLFHDCNAKRRLSRQQIIRRAA